MCLADHCGLVGTRVIDGATGELTGHSRRREPSFEDEGKPGFFAMQCGPEIGMPGLVIRAVINICAPIEKAVATGGTSFAKDIWSNLRPWILVTGFVQYRFKLRVFLDLGPGKSAAQNSSKQTDSLELEAGVALKGVSQTERAKAVCDNTRSETRNGSALFSYGLDDLVCDHVLRGWPKSAECRKPVVHGFVPYRSILKNGGDVLLPGSVCVHSMDRDNRPAILRRGSHGLCRPVVVLEFHLTKRSSRSRRSVDWKHTSMSSLLKV